MFSIKFMKLFSEMVHKDFIGDSDTSELYKQPDFNNKYVINENKSTCIQTHLFSPDL